MDLIFCAVNGLILNSKVGLRHHKNQYIHTYFCDKLNFDPKLKSEFLWQNCSNLILKTSIQGILSTSSGLPDTRIWFAQSRFSGGEKRRPNFPTSARIVLPLKGESLKDKLNANFLSPLQTRLLSRGKRS